MNTKQGGIQVSEELQEVINTNPEWYKELQYKDVKVFILDNINSTCRSFVAIGYYLKYIRDKKLFKLDGHEDIWDFAQAEFGISKSQASKFMNINDKFSKDGNSPILLDKYKEFSSSKLSEMLYLTDDQLEQVTVGTTVAQIREIRKPEPIVSMSKQEPEPEPNEVIRELQYYDKLAAYWCKREMTVELYELAKSDKDEDIDVFNQYFKEKYMHDGYAPAHNTPGYEISFRTDIEYGVRFDDIEKTGYSWDLLIELVCQEAENETPASKPANFHENPDGLKRLKEIRKELRDSRKVTESVETEPEYIESFIEEEEDDTDEVPCRNCKYDTMNPDEYLKDHPGATLPCIACDDKFSSWQPKDFEEETKPEYDNRMHRPNLRGMMQDPYCKVCGASLKYKQDCKCGNKIDWSGLELVFEYEEEQLRLKAKQEQTETKDEKAEIVEAEVIEIEPKEPPKPHYSAEHHLREAIKNEQEQIEIMGDHWKKYQPDTLLRHQTVLLALKCHLTDMEYPDPESVKPIQPELPVLRNNDQRKEFIDAYTTWPIWIDQYETGERYYRYDLTDKVAMVVKVSRKHSWQNYKETKEYEYVAEQYYLLGIKAEWHQTGVVYTEDESRTFYECSSNKSALVDYLKYFQKKGA
jgi:hypothetical protein